MKKIVFPLFFLLLTAGTMKAQYYRNDRGFMLGVNAQYTYPLGDMGKILKNGLGANLSAKYLINEVIGIGFEAGYHSFKTKMTLSNENTSQKYKCRIMPALLEATFYIPTWDRTILPYLGLHFGAYITNINVSAQTDVYGRQDVSKNLFLFSPGGGLHAGVMFEISYNTYLDLKIRADYVPKIEDKYEISSEEGYTRNNSIGFSKILNPSANIGLLYKF